VLSFFSSRRNWDSPTPPAAGECAPPPQPFGPGGGGTLACEGGVGGVPIPTRGQKSIKLKPPRGQYIHRGTLYILYKYFVLRCILEGYNRIYQLWAVVSAVQSWGRKGKPPDPRSLPILLIPDYQKIGHTVESSCWKFYCRQNLLQTIQNRQYMDNDINVLFSSKNCYVRFPKEYILFVDFYWIIGFGFLLSDWP
jgi:hypothetical protein